VFLFDEFLFNNMSVPFDEYSFYSPVTDSRGHIRNYDWTMEYVKLNIYSQIISS